MDSLVLVTLIILTGQHGAHSGILNAGPYNLKLIRHEKCDNPETDKSSTDLYIVKKSSRKAFLHGAMYMPYDLDDDAQEQMQIARLGAQGWKNNAYIYKNTKLCSGFLNNNPTMFNYFFKSWGIENPTCPIKAGNYTLDMDTDMPRMTKFPYLPYGTYRIVHSVLRGKPPVRVGCNVWHISCYETPR